MFLNEEVKVNKLDTQGLRDIVTLVKLEDHVSFDIHLLNDFLDYFFDLVVCPFDDENTVVVFNLCLDIVRDILGHCLVVLWKT